LAVHGSGEPVEDKPINHIVEADIKGFFDNVNQDVRIFCELTM